jgi:murein DD-endopeptidase MepM/ murein hydrolase activator NlpD
MRRSAGIPEPCRTFRGAAMRRMVALLALVVLGTAGVLRGVAAASPTPTGFYYPLDSFDRNDGYAGWLEGGPKPGGSYYWHDGAGKKVIGYHLGVDMKADVGTPVYAVAGGTVLLRSLNGWGDGNVGLAILHETADAGPFVAVYGHIKSTLLKGSTVDPHQPLGTVGPWTGGNHLHFGVHPGGGLWGNPLGRTEINNWPKDFGFVHPLQWIEKHVPVGPARPVRIKTLGTIGGILIRGRYVGRENVGLLLQPGSYEVSFTDENGFKTPFPRTLVVPIPLDPGPRPLDDGEISTTGEYHLRFNSEFMRHVTVQDGEVRRPGEQFRKIWELRNTGADTWTPDYTLRYGDGDDFGPNRIVHLPRNVGPGDSVEIGVDLTVGNVRGIQNSNWQIHTPDGAGFGVRVGVRVDIQPAVEGSIQPGQRPDGSIDSRFVSAFERNVGRSAVGRPLDFVREFGGGQLQEFDEGDGGRGNLSAPGGSDKVFWVHGEIYKKYDAEINAALVQGDLVNPLGLPVQDEEEAPRSRWDHDGRESQFQRGRIVYHKGGAFGGRAFEVHGRIYEVYLAQGGPGDWLGYPVTDEFRNDRGAQQSNFEGGYITSTDGGANYQAFHFDGDRWKAIWAWQSPHVELARGRSARLEVRFINAGTETWTRDCVHLGTSRDRDRISVFQRDDIVDWNPSGWASDNRIYMQQDSVPPGGVATFIFWMSPYGDQNYEVGHSYQEFFELVADCPGGGWFPENPGRYKDVWWYVKYTGEPEERVAQFVRQGVGDHAGLSHLELYVGQVVQNLWVEYRNLGRDTWFNNTTQQPVITLGTSDPRERKSSFFFGEWWPEAARASVHRDVSALEQAVPPLGTGRFRFHIKAPISIPEDPFIYNETFEPVQDSLRWYFGRGSEVTWRITVKRDPAPPRITSVRFEPGSPSRSGTIKLHVEASDPETGVQHIRAFAVTAPDGTGNGTRVPLEPSDVYDQPSATFTWNASNPEQFPDGVHRIEIEAWDYAGNWRRAGDPGTYHYFVLDRQGPQVELYRTVPQPKDRSGWNTTPVTITLSAADPSGIGGLFYAWDQHAQFQQYQSPMSAPEGLHRLYYYAVDGVGNRGALRSTIFRVDTGLPDTEITSSSVDSHVRSASFSFRGTDAVSTAAELAFSYQVDGGAWSSWSAATTADLTGLDYGAHSFRVKARDTVGNDDDTPASQTIVVEYGGTLLILPRKRDYGNVRVGQTLTLPLTFQNTSDTETMSLSLDGLAQPFRILDKPPALLAPGASARIRVSFTPTDVRPYKRTLLIRCSDPRKVVEFPLTGTGVAP